jgi:hypothetical protein
VQGLTRVGETFDGDHILSLALHREREAGQHAPAVDVDRARAARSLIAPFLRAGQPQSLSQYVQQARPRLDRQLAWHVIDHDLDRVVHS